MSFRIISNNLNTKKKTIYNTLSKDELDNFLLYKKNNILVIKFGATWCRPCNNIKNLLDSCFLEMPENVLCYDIDIDEDSELFNKLKSKKMVKSIPALLVYYCYNARDNWYIADNNISSSDNNNVINFFKQIYNNTKNN